MTRNKPLEIDMSEIQYRLNEHMEYRFEYQSGAGNVYSNLVMKGVYIIHFDLNLSDLVVHNLLSNFELCINHCIEGRVEWDEGKDYNHFIGQGDLHICDKNYTKILARMPLGRYKGVTILFQKEGIDHLLDILFDQNEDTRDKIFKVLRKHQGSLLLHTHEKTRMLFRELHPLSNQMYKQYTKIRLLMLIVYIVQMDFTSPRDNRGYFHEIQVTKVKKMREFMISNLDKHYTLDELSKMFDIPLTSMKNCFKAIYGRSIYDYLKSFRMHKATVLLCKSEKTITEIGIILGYSNASKFASAFKDIIGATPSEYRKHNKAYLFDEGL